VETARRALADDIAARAIRIIGVTDFVAAEAAPDPAPTIAGHAPPGVGQPGPDSLCPPLTAIRLEDLAP
jgi:hypothetical protein